MLVSRPHLPRLASPSSGIDWLPTLDKSLTARPIDVDSNRERHTVMPRVVRFNQEYFGYIVGFEDGAIHLYAPLAKNALREGATYEELAPFLLEELEVAPNFHLSSPLLVWLELTRKCNLTCPHCYIDAGEARTEELTTPQIMQLFEDLARMGVWAVTFTGGEPTMHPDFVALVREARERGLLVGIATNGTFLTESLLDQLPREGVIISVSFDKLHIRNPNDVESDFRIAARAVVRSRRMGFSTNIMTNTHKGNMDALDNLLTWARTNEVSIRSVPFSPVGRGHDHPELENTPEDVQKLAGYWLKEKEWEEEYHNNVGLCVGTIFDYGETLGYMTQRCSSGRYLCYVASDGTVYPCTSCAAEGILSPGSVRSSSLSVLWAEQWEIRDFSWKNFEDTCRGCPINNEKHYCSSRCPAFSYARHERYFDCGASDFQIHSTVVRTALLHASSLGESERKVQRAIVDIDMLPLNK